METVGEFLQQARKEKGLRLEDIAAKTRINIAYLEAVEANQFEKFPSEVNARGFVRAYALSIGLDPKEIMSRFDQSALPFFQKQMEAQHTFQKRGEPTKTGEPRRVRSQLILALVVCILFSVLYWVHSERLKEKDSQPTSTHPVEETPPTPQASGEPPFITGGPAINKPVLREESASGGVAEAVEPILLTLTIEAVEASWVAARIDDVVTKEVFLEPGERVSWIASERFNLSLGNAGGVKIEFNGKPLEPFGPKGAVVKDILLTRD